jgi:hypothetical protein
MADEFGDEKVGLSPRLRHRRVAHEGVLVHLEQGRVLVVNEVGVHVVEALGEQELTVAELAQSVAQSFAIDAVTARADVVAFLRQLRAEQAVVLSGSSGNERPSAGQA